MVSPDPADRFAAAARAAGCEVLAVRGANEAFVVVAGFLEREKTKKVAASASVVAAGCGDKLLLSAPRNAQEFAQARVGLVRADFGVAETGTLVRLDTDDGEKMLWTLPATCVCLLDRERVVSDLESLAGVISEHLARAGLPGPQVSLITGPSRTADIEGELAIGVQGPSRLIVLLVGEGRP
jgi:L-lactate dehydrogenase complex protein LldG